MNLSRSCWMFFIGLGAVAGAVLPTATGAQVPVRRDTVSGRRDTARTRVDTTGRPPTRPPAGKDTIKVALPARADSMLKNDSLIKSIVPMPPVKLDSLKAPLARAEAPAMLEIGQQRIYDRAAIFATGAFTLADILSRVPGLTEYTTGFLAAPTVVASMGDFRRIRLFIDGLEMDPMDLRARGVAPVNDFPLHALEEIRIERGADEVRVYGRTWRVDNTDPFTRSDVFTGDQNTNLFRAYLGRRFDHGEALQISADYGNTQPDRGLPSSDAINAMARLGITRGPWSADAFLERTGRSRAPWVGTQNQVDLLDTIPGIATHRYTSYVRLGNGDPETGRWFQAIASAHSYLGQLRATNSLSSGTDAAADSTIAASDSAAYSSQYVFAGGISRGAYRTSATERFRVGGGRVSHVLSARASATSRLASASLFAEGKSYLNPGRVEGSVRVTPHARVAIMASGSRSGGGRFDRLFTEPRSATLLSASGNIERYDGAKLTAADSSQVTRYALDERTNLRTEVGFRLRDVWLSAGALRRGATTLIAPSEFAGAYTEAGALRAEAEATARTIAARGRLWRAVNVDAWAVAWSDSLGFYRPRYQTRTELYIQTNLLNKFPKGNFGLLTSLAHEYRSSSRFPVPGDTIRMTPGYRDVAFRLEIRIQSAVISYQFRNLFQERYAEVPGFNLPRQTQMYGVRWEFWN